jgi:hypothetical protein
LILSAAILGAVLLDAALVVRLRRLRKAAMPEPGSPAGSEPAADAPPVAGPTITDDTGAGALPQRVREIRSDETTARARGAEDDRPRARDAEDDMTAAALAAPTASPIVAGAADVLAVGDLGRGSVRRTQWSGSRGGASAGRPSRRKR